MKANGIFSQGISLGVRLAGAMLFCLAAGAVVAQDVDFVAPPPMEILISVADQKLVVLRDGGLIGKYKISTSKYGVGDSYGSYKTPLGRMKIYDKIGGELPSGAVIKHRSATGEVIAANAPGRDPIVTRVMWLEGLEDQNSNAKARGIYIHGTPEESNLGKPVSWGCIRMRSDDVIALYDEVQTGTPVNIIADHLPHLHKWKPAPPPPPEVEPTPEPQQETLAKNKPADSKPAAKSAAAPAPAPQIAQQQMPLPVGEKIAPPKIARLKPSSQDAPEADFATNTAPVSHDKSNPEAIKAMKGSILMAGLPSPTAPKTTAQTDTHAAGSETLDGKAKFPQ